MSTKGILKDPSIHPAARLDARGRCCGVKAHTYKRPIGRRVCLRCDRQFDIYDHTQVENWAWKKVDGGFQSTEKVPGSVSVKGAQP